jgi:hypothetical protein
LTHVSEGIPPPEYKFRLLKYEENVVTSPFEGLISSEDVQEALGCETHYDKVSVKKPTENFVYQVHVFYGPEKPVQGCEMQFLIKFISKFDDTEFLNQVQYDFLVVDDNQKPIRSLAQDEGRQYLYSPSGQSEVDFLVQEDPGIAHYAIQIYGIAPEGLVPSSGGFDFLVIDVPVSPAKGAVVPTPTAIPEWIKNNAGWWAEGAIGDSDFVQGIQFLIKEGIMKISS